MTRAWYLLAFGGLSLVASCGQGRNFSDKEGAGSSGTSGTGGTSGGRSGLGGAAGSDGARGGSAGSGGSQVDAGGSSGLATGEGGAAAADPAGAGGAGADSACQEGMTRTCAEGDLSGPCAEGTQTCGSDETWGDCSIAPEAEDTCEPGNDANCNGTPNDGCGCTPDITRPCTGVEGNCADGIETCLEDGSGWSECSIQPAEFDACTPGDDATCDGHPNEGCPCVEDQTQPCGPEQVGICRRGTSTCGSSGTWGECVGAVNAQPRDCSSSEDNDCDGMPDDTIDATCQCEIGSTRACNTHPQDGTGICRAGTQQCVALQSGTASNWSSTCTGSQGPLARNCSSSMDNDCNGQPDNTIDNTCKCTVGSTRTCGTHPQDGIGICKAGTQTCASLQSGAASDWGTCTGSQGPLARDCGTTLDNDCDGAIDGGTGGPAFVKLPEGYCIDRTEVTRAQYQTWLNTNPSTGGQPVSCSWNTSFVPSSSCLNGANVCVNNCSNHPQVCVDWCDAAAYCKGVGKRLCGHISGGAVEQQNFDEVAQSQWHNACTSHGARIYPYGNTYDMYVCNNYHTVPTEWTAAVATYSSCQSSVSGYEGVFDMSGNVSEWENSCSNNDDNAPCNIRGGFFFDDDRSMGLLCAGTGTAVTQARNAVGAGTGFRCCSN